MPYIFVVEKPVLDLWMLFFPTSSCSEYLNGDMIHLWDDDDEEDDGNQDIN